MDRVPSKAFIGLCLAISSLAGCASPYHQDRGAAFGAATGGILGAVVGNATGHNGLAGAAIGATAGAITGSVVGEAMDEQEARNRAMIAAHMGREVRAGATTIADVVSMSQAGVADELIVNHIRGNGMSAPLTANDLIYLREQQISPRVVQAMQAPPTPSNNARPVVLREPAPVIVEEHYWGPGPGYYHRPYYHHHPHYCRPRSGVSYGVSISH